MTDQFEMFNQTKSGDIQERTSSPESDSGTTLCGWQNGRKIAPFGQALVHASRIVQQADKEVRQTIDTYGLNGCASSASAALQSYLESRLQMQFPSGGLTMFIKGWKRKATPLGRLYCQLSVSVRPISEIDCGLWPTPTTNTNDQPAHTKRGKETLVGSAKAALWATPAVRDHKDTPGQVALWPTTNSSDHRDRGSWGDPCIQRRVAKGKQINLSMIAQGTGKAAYGSTAQTENKGSLNPEFPCWLMGIPNEWVLSMQQGMESFRKSPLDSYEPLRGRHNDPQD